MAWSVRLPDGSLSEPFDTADEAHAFADSIDEYTGCSPEEIYDATNGPRVSRDVFLRRMRMGWKAHRALHTTMDGRHLGLVRPDPAARKGVDDLRGPAGALYEVLGRSRTIAEWAITSGVSESRIRKGIARYGSLQKYFLNIGWYPSKPAHPEPELDID